jgi:ABC-type nitrate/sulfonate/bicarbonate transport system permease component
MDYILHPFYRRGPGDLGIGWLLLASLRRVFIGFLLGSIVAIPVGFWIGTSRRAMLAINPLIQIFRPVSPVAWLPVALATFNLANPSASFFVWDEWNRLNLNSVFLAILVIGLTGLILDYLLGRLQVWITHRPPTAR